MKNEVIFVGKIDPYNSISSGVRGYVLGLSKALRAKGMKSKLIGYSSTTGENIDLINISQHKKISEHIFTLKLCVAAFSSNLSKKIGPNAIIHAQRADHALPFIFYKNKLILTLHGTREQAKEKYGILTYIMYSQVEKIVMKRIDGVIAVSEDIKNYYIEKYPYLKEKIKVLPNGVDVSTFKKLEKHNLRQKYNIFDSEKVVLYVGRLHPEKNLKLLIESMCYLNKELGLSVKLLIVGDGESKSDLTKLVSKLDLLDKILFLGTVPDSVLPEIMNCADVFALTSIVEGFPLVILEALACGLPVVSTNVGDTQKVVINDETGFLVESYSALDFATNLKSVLIENKNYSEQCIYLAKHYSWESIAVKTYEIYSE